MVGVRVAHLRGTNERVDFGGQGRARGGACSHLRGGKKGSEAVEDVRGDMVGGSLVAVHAQHVETGLYERLGRLPIKVDFGVAAFGVSWNRLCGPRVG